MKFVLALLITGTVVSGIAAVCACIGGPVEAASVNQPASAVVAAK